MGSQSPLGARRSGRTGKKLAQLTPEIQNYLDDLRQYQEQRQASRPGSDDEATISLTPPATPTYLRLWLQCREQHALLVQGGLLEQPFLLWLFVQTAGAVYESAQRLQAELANAAGARGET